MAESQGVWSIENAAECGGDLKVARDSLDRALEASRSV